MINTVKIQNDGYLVDGNKSVPNNPNNTDYQAVQRWLEGKTDDWLELEKTFNQETEAHDNWVDITTYEARLAQYEIDIVEYNDWVAAGSIEPALVEPIFPVKPKGYYTLDEVDASQAKYDQWVIDEAAFVPDEFNATYPVPAPEVFKRPIDLVEPTITPLPAPVPNVPEPEFTQAELDAQAEALRRKEIKDAGLALINEAFPALKNIDEIKFQAEFWLSIAPAARQATIDFQRVIDIYTTAKAAITAGTLPGDVVWP